MTDPLSIARLWIDRPLWTLDAWQREIIDGQRLHFHYLEARNGSAESVRILEEVLSRLDSAKSGQLE